MTSKPRSGGHRGVQLTRDELEMVAFVYLGALGLGLETTSRVAEHFGLSRSMAAKRVMFARRMGPIEPAGPRDELGRKKMAPGTIAWSGCD